MNGNSPKTFEQKIHLLLLDSTQDIAVTMTRHEDARQHVTVHASKESTVKLIVVISIESHMRSIISLLNLKKRALFSLLCFLSPTKKSRENVYSALR
jgi:hypothetical protein